MTGFTQKWTEHLILMNFSIKEWPIFVFPQIQLNKLVLEIQTAIIIPFIERDCK